MQIFLLRHGIARPASPGSTDADRSLTPEGEQQVRRLARSTVSQMRKAAIVSSPYRRAQQTAQIVADELGGNPDCFLSSALTPESSVLDAWAEIRAHRNGESLLVVGHEPLFSALTAFLLGFPALEIEFSPATLACVTIEEFTAQPRGLLRWVLAARLLD